MGSLAIYRTLPTVRSGEHQLAHAGGVVAPRRARGDEAIDRGDEAGRVVELREGPGALALEQLAARHDVVGTAPVADGDDRVAVAPHDEQRQVGGEVEAIERAH